MLSARIRAFLLGGGEGNGTTADCVASSRGLMVLYEDAERDAARQRERDEALVSRVNAQHEHFHSVDVLSMLQRQRELELNLQFVQANEALSRLEASDDVDEIPRLVLLVQQHMPPRLPRQTATKRRLDAVVAAKRASLLASFHAQFEAQLSEAAEPGDAHLWSAFLHTARTWLLAYSTTSLLPAVLSESPARVVDLYQQEVLEEALLPLWGRFLFHLTAAREDASQDQLLWTFGYARSHVELLCDLSGSLASGLLQRLCPGGYREAGAGHVVEKAVRFLRAHVAQILLTHGGGGGSSSSGGSGGGNKSDVGDGDGGALLRVLESSLELDRFLCDQYPRHDALTITAVFCDAPAIFRRWLEADWAKLRSLAEAVCFDADSVYRPAFASKAPTPLEGPRPQLFCYRGVYELLSLFVLASRRYELLPAAAQAALCAAVLEPLLLAAVGLVLLRVPSCQVLHAVYTCADVGRASVDGGMPAELSQFVAAVAYLDAALAASSVRAMWTCPERFSGRLEELAVWLPKHCTAREAGAIRREFEFSPYNLLGMAMPFPSPAAANHGQSRTVHMGDVVDAARAQIQGLSDDLCRRWRE